VAFVPSPIAIDSIFFLLPSQIALSFLKLSLHQLETCTTPQKGFYSGYFPQLAAIVQPLLLGALQSLQRFFTAILLLGALQSLTVVLLKTAANCLQRCRGAAAATWQRRRRGEDGSGRCKVAKATSMVVVDIARRGEAATVASTA
jgi:hypothetical protein